jgi:hypothetical protein
VLVPQAARRSWLWFVCASRELRSEALPDLRVCVCVRARACVRQASLAGMLWATGDKAGAQKMADAVGGKDVLATFVQAQQVRRVGCGLWAVGCVPPRVVAFCR